jgi:hypothetical protein
MAATIATARGMDSARVKESHRLGSRAAEATAATWRTFATVTVYADGSGTVTVTRDGSALHRYAFGSENVTLPPEPIA